MDYRELEQLHSLEKKAEDKIEQIELNKIFFNNFSLLSHSIDTRTEELQNSFIYIVC